MNSLGGFQNYSSPYSLSGLISLASTGPTGSGPTGPMGSTGATGSVGPTGYAGPGGTQYGDYLLWDGVQYISFGENSVALGRLSGSTGQTNNSVAIGANAGTLYQGLLPDPGNAGRSVAVGINAGAYYPCTLR